jgi:Dolichyl-phosphate-mannose-protein mannosyltransferase
MRPLPRAVLGGRLPVLLVVAAAALPRLVALGVARDNITGEFRDKSDTFARVFVESGTFGFIPGHPSAYTQPLYGFFLTPIYAVFGQSWLAVGLAQVAVAVATALLVLAIARRVVEPGTAVVAALLATLHPYVVWHDVHLNREILDQLLAAALVLGTLIAAERFTPARAAGLGVVFGLSVLANVRLALLPLVVLGYVAWQRGLRREVVAGSALALAVAALVVAPWVVRNRVSVGCWAVTTDARALWKANNANTKQTLEERGWIDFVPDPPGAPMSPQSTGQVYEYTGRILSADECAQMRDYQDRVFDFWSEHPGEKAELTVVAVGLLWSPTVTTAEDRPGAGTWLDTVRTWAEPAYAVLLYAFALVGAFLVARRYLVLTAALLAYQTAIAMVFVGATRYRVPWDFLLCVLAAPALVGLGRAVQGIRRRAAAAG